MTDEELIARLRADEMLRVAARYIRDHYPDGLIDYDNADCDGACVADDCEAAADALIGEAVAAIRAMETKGKLNE